MEKVMTLDFLGVVILSFCLMVYYNVIPLLWRNRLSVVNNPLSRFACAHGWHNCA